MEAEAQLRGMPVMVQLLPAGAKLQLQDGSRAEVTENPKDGSWIFVRYISRPSDPSQEGQEGLVFADDVVRVEMEDGAVGSDARRSNA